MTGGNMVDDRLEKLSDLVRQGILIDIDEALEVIAYQESNKMTTKLKPLDEIVKVKEK